MGVFSMATAGASSPDANPLIGSRWDFAPIADEQTSVDHGMKLNVVIQSRWTFSEKVLKNEVMCRYEKPLPKTLIATAETPIEYDTKVRTLHILQNQFERQEYKVVLEPKAKDKKSKLKKINMSLFCKADINKGSLKYKVSGDELVVEPIVVPFVLKRVSTDAR